MQTFRKYCAKRQEVELLETGTEFNSNLNFIKWIRAESLEGPRANPTL